MNKDIESRKELATVIMCYKNLVQFMVNNFSTRYDSVRGSVRFKMEPAAV